VQVLHQRQIEIIDSGAAETARCGRAIWPSAGRMKSDVLKAGRPLRGSVLSARFPAGSSAEAVLANPLAP